MKELTVALVASSKLIGAGMATVGIVGAGVGIGVLFGFFISSLGRNPFLEFRKASKSVNRR
jgi:F0F1-type ATP synthase membrane subunit c/vacuolar-type H+-ATPase subunit K